MPFARSTDTAIQSIKNYRIEVYKQIIEHLKMTIKEYEDKIVKEEKKS